MYLYVHLGAVLTQWKAFDALRSIINYILFYIQFFGFVCICTYVMQHYNVVQIPALTATCFGCSAAVMRGVLDKDCCPPAASDSLSTEIYSHRSNA